MNIELLYKSLSEAERFKLKELVNSDTNVTIKYMGISLFVSTYRVDMSERLINALEDSIKYNSVTVIGDITIKALKKWRNVGNKTVIEFKELCEKLNIEIH